MNAGLEFITEARKEITRLTAGNKPASGEEDNRDKEGFSVITGDIVVIKDNGMYHGWSA